jgi:hypothetical protein
MKLAEIQHAIEELPEDQQAALAAWVAQRDRSGETSSETLNESRPSDLRELRGSGGIRPDYDYKSLRIGDPRE